ncbi:hypothetical protein SARC_13771 [Sphaeroforma arctica JP610]|uniref:Protein-serine/threonine kinase n=1 Tax=Sphaeroforma arctica JP610 TaxID=667725 RepID=A0A0L0FAA4_9EUKA|nr:hypothetical protein SARC_13771 [Sphaeroforma arctica JP610]KNC73670.1 hypothetical protein SARC_13771 [Sphaeroforma arctica JP610]|eukprot:XP_014147572.1 hypothetical protein SARC_13771 [Sphaeroforma arctica JP610]
MAIAEVLKNAMRATCEFHKETNAFSTESLPPVEISVCKSDSDFFIRIRDHGGGISKAIYTRVMEYSFTTAKDYQTELESGGLSLTSQNPAGPMAGLGFGLPMTRVYAEYFGGSMDMYTMDKYGTDVFLRLRHFDDVLVRQRLI